MTELEYYNKIKELIENKKLDLYIIIAPPRTSSTLIESIVTKSDDIDFQCHEPFIPMGYYGQHPDHGYRNIYDSIGGDHFQPKKRKPTTLVIKEMSHWIIKFEEYRRLFELTKHPILFVSRNPVLSMESRIRKVIESIDMKPRESTIDWLSTKLGSDNEVLKLSHKSYNDNADSRQTILLDAYSKQLGFDSWSRLKQQSFETHDYTKLNDLLFMDPKRFSLEPSAWTSLETEVQYAKENGIDYVVVDSTDLRSSPFELVPEVCRRWNIKSGDEMLTWDAAISKVKTGQDRPHDMIWYDTLMKSQGINPPTEEPASFSQFPERISVHLADVEIPSYVRVYQDRNAVRPSSIDATMEKIDPIYYITAVEEAQRRTLSGDYSPNPFIRSAQKTIASMTSKVS